MESLKATTTKWKLSPEELMDLEILKTTDKGFCYNVLDEALLHKKETLGTK